MTRSDQFYSALGRRIRDARARKGWTQVQLAAELDYVSGAVVSYWESGQRHPSLWDLRRIEDVTGVAVVS